MSDGDSATMIDERLAELFVRYQPPTDAAQAWAEIAPSLDGKPAPFRRVRRTRSRPVRIAWAVGMLAFVLAVAAPLTLAGGPTPPSSPVPTIPPGSLSQWLVVAPGGGSSGGTATPIPIDVIDPASGAVRQVSAPESGMTRYPWTVQGAAAVMVTGLPENSVAGVTQGAALVVVPGTGLVEPLGAASDVVASTTPDAVWVESSPAGRPCTLRETSVTGQALTRAYTVDCSRWVVAAVDGGLLSSPVRPSSPYTTLQVWNPSDNRVVRTIASNAAFVAASGQFVEWRTEGQMASSLADLPQTSGVQLTDVASGQTRSFTPHVPRGMVLADTPLLAPVGPFIEYRMGTAQAVDFLEAGNTTAGGCVGGCFDSSEGRTVVEDFTTGATLLDRVSPITSAPPTWTSNDSYLVAATDRGQVAFIPMWSASAPVHMVQTPESDAVEFTIVARSSIPTPVRLDKTLTFGFDGVKLSPPPAGVMPVISASQAWWAAHVTQAAASYELLLAQWHSTVPLVDGTKGITDALMWVVIGTNVEVPDRGPGSHRPVSTASAMWPVDAGTGYAFGELTW